MHTTVNGTTTESAVAQSLEAQAFVEARQDRLLRTAERIVKRLAPPPDPIEADYAEAAADTEIAVFVYLSKTGEGAVSRTSSSAEDLSTSESLKVDGVIESLVRNTMGSYFLSEEKTSHNTGYISSFPISRA